MIKSMTGFGKGESNGKSGRFTVEIRTVNHKYFDLSARIPNSLNQLEDRIKKFLNNYIKRGKVNFSLFYRLGEKDIDNIRLNDEAIEKYFKMLNKIKKRFRLGDDISLSHILSFPDVVIVEEGHHDVSSVWSDIEAALRKALTDCNKMRKREGRALYRDLTKRIDKIFVSVNKIAALAPKIVYEYKKRLYIKIKELLKGRNIAVDGARLETEVALFARQSDISEEITRTRSHLDSLKKTLNSDDEAGRRLDFILQELQREINTLGSKAVDITVSRRVVDIKSELNKMREQVQNIE